MMNSNAMRSMRSLKFITRSTTSRPLSFKRPTTQIVSKSSVSVQPPTFFKDENDPPKTLDELKQKTEAKSSIQPPASPPPQQQKRDKNDNGWIAPCTSIILALIVVIIVQQQQIEALQKQNTVTHVALNKLAITYKSQMDRSLENFSNVLQLRSYQKEMITCKLLVHIALLRRQILTNTTLTPIEINESVKQFYQVAKISKSKTDTRVWVRDDCDIKRYMPHANDYEDNTDL